MRNDRENPTKFKASPKIPDYQDSKERNIAGGRYKKVYADPSGTNIWLRSKVTSILEIRIFPKARKLNNLYKESGMGVPPVLSARAGRPSHKNHKIVSYLILIPKLGLYIVEVVSKKLEQPLQVNQQVNQIVAAIDLGLNNLATLIYNIAGLVPTTYDGRALKSTNQYCNRVSTKLKSLLPAAPKNSKKVANLWHKRNCKVDSYFHITSSAIIKELVNQQIGLLVRGGKQDFKDEINPGKVNRQKIACIPHRRLVQMLQHKGQIGEIQVLLVGESYISKCSALDLQPIQQKSEYIGCRVKRGLFRTQSGQLINGDVKGSLNQG